MDRQLFLARPNVKLGKMKQSGFQIFAELNRTCKQRRFFANPFKFYYEDRFVCLSVCCCACPGAARANIEKGLVTQDKIEDLEMRSAHKRPKPSRLKNPIPRFEPICAEYPHRVLPVP
eukprot:scaffold29086_cov19-Prasinocladus_malaysianus.AAC.1